MDSQSILLGGVALVSVIVAWIWSAHRQRRRDLQSSHAADNARALRLLAADARRRMGEGE